MKRILCIAIGSVFMLCTMANAQNQSESSIGLTVSSLGSNDVFDTRVGSPSYNSGKLFAIGITYMRPVKSWLDIQTGIEYSTQSVRAIPNIPNANTVVSSSDLTLINIPFTLQATFLKYLFVNAGTFLGIDISEASTIDEQTGLGAMLGIGASVDFSSRVSGFLNPYAKYHSLVPLAGQDQNVLERGIRAGIMVKLQ